MGCATCATKDGSGAPAGCKSNGHCATGGCNKMNTYDWLNDIPMIGEEVFDVVEISFKGGSRKDFYRKKAGMHFDTGDLVAVEAQFGYDIGQITLSGELVRLQMKKKAINESAELPLVLRRTNDRDMDRYEKGIAMEKEAMLQARVIARSLGLAMKIGDVEYQGDLKKATFYYTADDRVDFRELIKLYAREFKVKIEMRQIGARQEAGRIGGIGSCGRELCCSTWLSDFKSVSTSAARYQNLAINQAKLSGQCGRLKCCLNYELDTYMEALLIFPDNADVLKTKEGEAYLQKTDIFKKLMFYTYPHKMKYYKLNVERVKEVLEMNKNGTFPEDLATDDEPEVEISDYEDTVGQITLEVLERRDKKRKKKRRNKPANRNKNQNEGNIPKPDTRNKGNRPAGGEGKTGEPKKRSGNYRRRKK